MNGDLADIIVGTLLGDATIKTDADKYFSYKHSAKDKKYLEWQNRLLEKQGIKGCIGLDNKISEVYRLGFYINSLRNNYLTNLHKNWYAKVNGRYVKHLPKDLNIGSLVLLHWYLGDGSLIRQKGDRIPRIVLATNNFSKQEISSLSEKLKLLELNFYPLRCFSGFKNGKECGYVLISKTDDGTPFRFFRLIGLDCPSEIANCITGRKGRGARLHYFRDKWPNEEDWIRILSNTSGLGKILKEKRKEIGLSQGKLAKKIGINRNSVKRIERGRRYPSVTVFKKLLNAIDINSTYLIERLNRD